MNASESLDFVLGKLEGDAAAQASRQIETDTELVGRLQIVRQNLDLILDDDDAEYAPPAGLAARTLAFVDREKERRQQPVILEMAPGRLRMRREDLAVAATVFLASVVALAPAILRGRESWGRASCQNNLQKVGMRLHQYAAINHYYPYVAPEQEVPHVGTIVCRLNDAGFTIDPADLQCPGGLGARDEERKSLPKLDDVAARWKVSPEEACKMISANDYGFHVGNYSGPGLYHDPDAKAGPLSALASHAVPIVADRPSFDHNKVLTGNSPNHGRQGQNVLFADGHSSWHKSRHVTPTDSDLYLNELLQEDYGVSPDDAVLMPASFRVRGR